MGEGGRSGAILKLTPLPNILALWMEGGKRVGG